MFTKIKNWFKKTWLKIKKWFMSVFGIGVVMAAGSVCVDATQFNEQPIQTKDIIVAEETVHIEQKGNVIEAVIPWKGQKGLTIKYDLGEPTTSEKLNDKREKKIKDEKVAFQQTEGLKLDVILDKKPKNNIFCYQIEGWEDYEFYYQPPLSEQNLSSRALNCTDTDCYNEEGGVEVHQDEEIVGSYAVYHKGLKDNDYKSGKFGHIPYPYIWEVDDETTKHRAEDFTYNKGELCVTVSQEFLDNATYPVRIDPTFGRTDVGGGTESLWPYDLAHYWVHTLGVSDADVSKISFYLDASTEMTAKTAIYDTSAGVATTQSSLSSATTVTTSAGWFDFTITDTLAAGDYALAFGVGSVDDNIVGYRDAQVPVMYEDTANPFNDPWGTSDDSWNSDHSIYATYTVAAADTCTYSSGDWNVDFSDNCFVASDVYVNGDFNLIYDSAGSFGLAAEIGCDDYNIGAGAKIDFLNGSGKLSIY